jgi:hypothetical protein
VGLFETVLSVAYVNVFVQMCVSVCEAVCANLLWGKETEYSMMIFRTQLLCKTMK